MHDEHHLHLHLFIRFLRHESQMLSQCGQSRVASLTTMILSMEDKTPGAQVVRSNTRRVKHKATGSHDVVLSEAPLVAVFS